MNGLHSPLVALHFSQLTRAMPAAWSFRRSGRACSWQGQALGDPADRCSPVIVLDRRGALRLDDRAHERSAWRRPVDQHRLHAHVNAWAARRLAQWEVLVTALGLADAEHRQLLVALQRHEWSQCLPLVQQVWSASLNSKLEVPIANEPSDQNLLRWVLAARCDGEYRRRRRMARRHARLLVLGRVYMPPSFSNWPQCLRKLDERALFEGIDYLGLNKSLLTRVSRFPIGAAPQWQDPHSEYGFWARLQTHLPADVWPTEGAELQAAEELLRCFSPFFSFGLEDEDALFDRVERKRGLWFVGQLAKHHGGSWSDMRNYWVRDQRFTGLVGGTLPRLREVFEVVNDGDLDRLERSTKHLRMWTPGRWIAALQKWHGMSMPGGRAKLLSWEPMLDSPMRLNDFSVGSPQTITDLEELIKELNAGVFVNGLPWVLAGQGQFLWLRSHELDQLYLLALIAAERGEDGVWVRDHKVIFASSVQEPIKALAEQTLQAALAGALPLNEDGLMWREGWESTFDHHQLRLSLCRSMHRLWESITV